MGKCISCDKDTDNTFTVVSTTLHECDNCLKKSDKKLKPKPKKDN